MFGGQGGSVASLGVLGGIIGMMTGNKKAPTYTTGYTSEAEVAAIRARDKQASTRSGHAFGMVGSTKPRHGSSPYTQIRGASHSFSNVNGMFSLNTLLSPANVNKFYESPITSRQRQTQSYTKYVTDSVLTRAMNPTLSGSSIDKLVEMYQTRETRMQGPSIPERRNWYGGFRALAQHGGSHLLEQGLSKMYKTKKTNTGAARRVTRKAL